jgi:D-alanyl-D-alanine carboxypeptidase
MKKSFFTLALFVTLVSAIRTQAQVSPFVAGRLQYTLDSVCNKYKIRGTSAAVLIPDIGIWKGTNGTSETGVSLTSDMLLGMGSNTKTHMAATLLKLQEQQLLSLDDTIGQWIIGYPNISGQITVRQCLNHTSGLFDYMQNGAINDSIFGHEDKIWLPEEILWLAQTPNFAPGTSWSYSNTNYIIAGIVISKVMNKPAFEVVRDLILTPNQLSNTFNFGEQGSVPFAHPWSMSLGANATDMTTTPYLYNLFSLANTAGSLITTAEDNVQFWHKLWSGQIINAQSWEEMTQLKSIGGADGYGLGIFRYSRKINGRTIYSHGGTFFGYINENMVDTTSGVTISVLTNQDSVNNNGLLNLVVKALHKVTLNMPATGIDEAGLTDQEVAVYPNPANDRITIQLDRTSFSGKLMLTDITGKTLHQEVVQGNLFDMMVSDFPTGLYLLTLQDSDGRNIYAKRIQILN